MQPVISIDCVAVEVAVNIDAYNASVAEEDVLDATALFTGDVALFWEVVGGYILLSTTYPMINKAATINMTSVGV